MTWGVLLSLWPAAALILWTLAVGVVGGLMADTWLRMREERRATIRGDRIPG